MLAKIIPTIPDVLFKPNETLLNMIHGGPATAPRRYFIMPLTITDSEPAVSKICRVINKEPVRYLIS
ncbi:hypothetical protein AUM41_18290 [Cronobacter malonaticus]|nr:hypothetical protein [Cronobacter malonaticus]EGT4420775.1 hypothetical protein [Cronobacter malonaticus]EGT4445309.1 hypothetical protein [Cronobacter malonaticus]EGT4456174.1 hypothetical protein [Cronobacter malonaticus]PUX19086.1 hypothetical protein BS413_12445 [Cronobacter malonaticus]